MSDTARPIRHILVANRAEIAARVISTASAMGIETTAVCSDADRGLPYVAMADQAVHLPGATPAETYLRGDLLVEAARRVGADAVHPGYGFLSENAGFAAAVVDAGLVWVGPTPDVIASMGSKVEAKATVEAAGVPTLPSIVLDDDAPPDGAAVAALGYPLLVKASAGGGGRGMRLVREPAELADAIASARREALSAFGDATVFLEHFVTDPRHIEVQIFGDAHGTVVALFERECSIQRRHQKIVEEAPSPVVDDEWRERLCAAAVNAARAVGYTNAGTVEFVADARTREHYFLEMNTRLQVEHPVTEGITGLDLVRLQIQVARGEPIGGDVLEAIGRGPRGHAVEARLYAEDPRREWLPSVGALEAFSVGGGVRVDAGYASGSTVSPYYDSMLAKVVAHGATRAEAIDRLARALRGARIRGPVTNRDLLVRTVEHPSFRAGETDTGFLDRHGLALLATPLPDAAALDRHCIAAVLALAAARRAEAAVQGAVPAGWRNNPAIGEWTALADGDGRARQVTYRYRRDGSVAHAAVTDHVLGTYLHVEDVEDHGVRVVSADPGEVVLEADGVLRAYAVSAAGERVFVDGPEGASALDVLPRFAEPGSANAPGSAVSPMPGTVVRLEVAPGAAVAAGDTLVVLEAMKMEHGVHADADGTVSEILVAVGDQVDSGQVLVVVAPAGGEPAA